MKPHVISWINLVRTDNQVELRATRNFWKEDTLKDFPIIGTTEIITALKPTVTDTMYKVGVILNNPPFIKLFLKRETDYMQMVDFYKKNSRNGVMSSMSGFSTKYTSDSNPKIPDITTSCQDGTVTNRNLLVDDLKLVF